MAPVNRVYILGVDETNTERTKDETMSNDTNALNIAKIEAVYLRVSNGWDGADWTHEAEIEFNGDADEDDERSYCTGDVDGCALCAEAKADAKLAEAHGANAIAMVRQGDMDGALNEVEWATAIEGEYGDTPTWGPLWEAIVAAMEA